VLSTYSRWSKRSLFYDAHQDKASACDARIEVVATQPPSRPKGRSVAVTASEHAPASPPGRRKALYLLASSGTSNKMSDGKALIVAHAPGRGAPKARRGHGRTNRRGLGSSTDGFPRASARSRLPRRIASARRGLRPRSPPNGDAGRFLAKSRC
jgi:hypothetical protein